MRELEMFRGAKSWAKGNVFKAVERQKAKRAGTTAATFRRATIRATDAAAGVPGCPPSRRRRGSTTRTKSAA